MCAYLGLLPQVRRKQTKQISFCIFKLSCSGNTIASCPLWFPQGLLIERMKPFPPRNGCQCPPALGVRATTSPRTFSGYRKGENTLFSGKGLASRFSVEYLKSLSSSRIISCRGSFLDLNPLSHKNIRGLFTW